MKSIKFVFFKAIVFLFLTFGTSDLFSQTSSENYIKTDAANKVQFVGADADYLIFEIRFNELPPKGYTLQITDDTGNFYFDEFISGNFFSKRFKIPREGMSRISFKASGRNFSFNQSFTIKKEEKLVVTAN